MVKLRGIEISVISQFDIQKLPEFPLRHTSPSSNRSYDTNKAATKANRGTASCYIPIYPGSQFWFEYSVDGPHPPNAAYLFKLLLDGRPIVSWDCTAKHGYHGKMMYNLLWEGYHDTGETKVLRQAMHFPSEPDNEPRLHQFMDVIEIWVHRIEHRKRIRQVEQGLGQVSSGNKNEHGLRFHNGGYLEPGFPRRLYKYQLLDPVDEPYATFCFYYRNSTFLEKHGIAGADTSTMVSAASSGEWHECPSSAVPITLVATPRGDTTLSTHLSSSTDLAALQESRRRRIESPVRQEHTGREKRRSGGTESCLSHNDSGDSLSILTKDSVEDLNSAVSRSPKTVEKNWKSDDRSPHNYVPPSPSLSPRRRFKKRLTVNHGGAGLDFQGLQRPLSPFAGLKLRKLISSSAPYALTDSGLDVEGAVRPRQCEDNRSNSAEDTFEERVRKDRSNRSWVEFLGKRFAS